MNDNTVVFDVDLILPEGQNLGPRLCALGLAELDVSLIEAPAPEPVSDDDDDDVGSTLAADAGPSFGVLTPVSPLAVAADSTARLSAKRLV